MKGARGRGARAFCAAAFLSIVITGCGASAHVERVVAPNEVDSYRVGTLREVALIRANREGPIAPGASIRSGKLVTAANSQIVNVPISDADVLEADSEGRITGIRRKNGSSVRFEPGTATSPDGASFVRGILLGTKTTGNELVLSSSDRVRMAGDLSSDQQLPDGTRVTTKRFTFGLVAGVTILSLAYVPTFISGATSGESSDRVLMAPIVGPWINLGMRPGCGAEPANANEQVVRDYASCEVTERAAKILLPISGITQGVGALLLILGLPETATLDEPKARGTGARVRFAPLISDQPGMMAVGQF